jgi:hypothetical protein
LPSQSARSGVSPTHRLRAAGFNWSRALLESEQNNDEVEVTGEMFRNNPIATAKWNE